MQVETPPVVKCDYCKQHRWCLACKISCNVPVDTCGKCDGPLEPAPTKRGEQYLHEPCAKVSEIVNCHQILLGQVANHAASAYGAVLERVIRLNFTGWLDARVSSDVGGTVIQSRVQFMLRKAKTPQRRGWASLWVSPDLVQLIRGSNAQAETPASPATETPNAQPEDERTA